MMVLLSLVLGIVVFALGKLVDSSYIHIAYLGLFRNFSGQYCMYWYLPVYVFPGVKI